MPNIYSSAGLKTNYNSSGGGVDAYATTGGYNTFTGSGAGGAVDGFGVKTPGSVFTNGDNSNNMGGSTSENGDFSVNTSDGEIIAWNVSAIRQVSSELKTVSQNFDEAHQTCSTLVPKINSAWESNLASEKFSEKLDFGLVRHFLEGEHALSVLATVLERIADVYEDCENRIKNGDYGTSYRVGESVGGEISWADEGFNNVSAAAETVVRGGVLGAPTPIDNKHLTAAEKEAFPLGLPIGAYTRSDGTEVYYYDSKGELLGKSHAGKFVAATIEPETFSNRWGKLPTGEGKEMEELCNGAKRVAVTDLTEDELKNLRKIYDGGVSSDVEFYRAKDGTLFTAIRNAIGHVGMDSEESRKEYLDALGNGTTDQSAGVTVYKVEDGYLDMIAECSEEDVRNAQEARAKAREKELASMQFDSDVDYDVKVETVNNDNHNNHSPDEGTSNPGPGTYPGKYPYNDDESNFSPVANKQPTNNGQVPVDNQNGYGYGQGDPTVHYEPTHTDGNGKTISGGYYSAANGVTSSHYGGASDGGSSSTPPAGTRVNQVYGGSGYAYGQTTIKPGISAASYGNLLEEYGVDVANAIADANGGINYTNTMACVDGVKDTTLAGEIKDYMNGTQTSYKDSNGNTNESKNGDGTYGAVFDCTGEINPLSVDDPRTGVGTL